MTGARHSANKRRFQFHSSKSFGNFEKGTNSTEISAKPNFPSEIFEWRVKWNKNPRIEISKRFLYLESLSSFPETVPFVTGYLRTFKPLVFGMDLNAL